MNFYTILYNDFRMYIGFLYVVYVYIIICIFILVKISIHERYTDYFRSIKSIHGGEGYAILSSVAV